MVQTCTRLSASWTPASALARKISGTSGKATLKRLIPSLRTKRTSGGPSRPPLFAATTASISVERAGML